MTVLAAALAALVAAEPGPAAAPPTPTPAATPSPPPPPSEWVTGSDEPSAPSTPPRAPPNLPPMPHSLSYSPLPPPDWSLGAGWGTAGLMGVTGTGVEITFEAAQPLAARPRGLALVTADLFVGETRPGLAIRSFALGAELWYEAPRVRAGGGVGTGIVGYRRATNGEWPLLLTVGLRAGIEIAVLRSGASDVVLGAHGAANVGPWVSGYFTLGYRGRASPPATR